MNHNHALVILSGGQDSTYCLAWATQQFETVSAVTFNYGQRHAAEIMAARRVAALLGVTDHEVVELGDGILKGTSPLTNKNEVLEQYTDYSEMDQIIGDRVEKTFVPMRNSLFLTLAANRAVVMGAGYLVTGVCEQDNANYPDCRRDFILTQQAVINEALGLNDGIQDPMIISTPLINTQKSQAINHMIEQGWYYLLAFTHTAYDGQYPPLGKDHATLLRAQSFLEAGVPDPLMVRAWTEGLVTADQVPNLETVLNAELMQKIREAKNFLAERGLLCAKGSQRFKAPREML